MTHKFLSKHNQRFAAIAITCVSLTACNTSPGPKSDPAARTTTQSVHIQPTGFLEAPILGSERAYKPACSFDLDPTPDERSPTAAIFHLSVETTDIARINARLTDTINGTSSQLVHLQTPQPLTFESNCQEAELTPKAQSILSDDHGIFWVNPSAKDSSTSSHQVTVTIPTSMLSPSTSLELYADETSTGDPLGGDRIELVRDFFYLVAVGDSVVWGNGLLESDKFTSHVAATIERNTGSKVIRTVYAMSGATLSPTPFDEVCTFRCGGEVPTAYRSVDTQINNMEFPEQIDLILLDGCINDVDLGRIFSIDTTTQEIEELTAHFCGDEMRSTLTQLNDIAPNVPIVVTGYYSVVSEESDFSSVFNWAIAQGFDLGNVASLSDVVSAFAANSNTFHETSTSALMSAVEFANRQSDDPRIQYVDPGFKPENAVFAEESWVWNLRLDREVARRIGISTGLIPEDPQWDFRAKACFERNAISDPFTCLFASVGHPNPKGAKAYANAITKTLREMGIIPE